MGSGHIAFNRLLSEWYKILKIQSNRQQRQEPERYDMKKTY